MKIFGKNLFLNNLKIDLNIYDYKTIKYMSIQLIIGPMFSGKTTELQRIIRRYMYAGKEIIIIKHINDNRYDEENFIVSHDKHKIVAIPVSKLSDVFTCIKSPNQFDIIGIDEGQLFPNIVEFSNRCANLGKIVVISALDADYRQEPFGDICSLIPKCERVTKLTSVCVNCGKDASFTKRTSDETEIVVIGGTDKYIPVCRQCF